MKIGRIDQVNLVKNFVKANATCIRISGRAGKKSSTIRKPMYIYGKNGEYLGEHIHDSYFGGHLWHTLIMGKDIKPKAQEIVYVQRKEIWLHPETEEEINNMKKLTTEITTTTTVLDHIKNTFITVRNVCKLMNPLEEMKIDDPNCIMSGTYKPLKEKPHYITCVEEVLNEGSISKVNESIICPEISGKRPGALTPHWYPPINTTISPGKFWYRSGK